MDDKMQEFHDKMSIDERVRVLEVAIKFAGSPLGIRSVYETVVGIISGVNPGSFPTQEGIHESD